MTMPFLCLKVGTETDGLEAQKRPGGTPWPTVCFLEKQKRRTARAASSKDGSPQKDQRFSLSVANCLDWSAVILIRFGRLASLTGNVIVSTPCS